MKFAESYPSTISELGLIRRIMRTDRVVMLPNCPQCQTQMQCDIYGTCGLDPRYFRVAMATAPARLVAAQQYASSVRERNGWIVKPLTATMATARLPRKCLFLQGE